MWFGLLAESYMGAVYGTIYHWQEIIREEAIMIKDTRNPCIMLNDGRVLKIDSKRCPWAFAANPLVSGRKAQVRFPFRGY